jgi:competence protein ComEA
MVRILVVLLAVFLFACEDGRSRGQMPAEVININQATVKDLEALPGIGPVRAKSIVAARNARGGMFATYEEILSIDGIGPTTLDRIRPMIVLGPPKPKN